MKVESLNNIGLQTIEFVDTHTARSSGERFLVDELKPDVSVYTRGSGETAVNFGRMELWIELKSESDVFVDNNSNAFIRDSDKAKAIVGQLISYAVAQLSSGFWTHCFSVVVFSNGARLIRWDRAGSIVTERIDLSTEDGQGKLVEFFHRFDQLTPEQRGRDPSVRDPSDEQRQLAFGALQPKLEVDEAEDSYLERKSQIKKSALLEYLVMDAYTGRTKSFIGPPPKRYTLSLQGRSTRGCPVYDVETGKICYLKDTWRVDSPQLMKEGDTYSILLQSGVEQIAKAVAHGDVTIRDHFSNRHSTTRSSSPRSCELEDRPDTPPLNLGQQDGRIGGQTEHSYNPDTQRTQTDKFCQMPWVHGPKGRVLQGYVHYRLVVNIVGRDITSFKSAKEVFRVFADILTGICDF